MLCVCVSNPYGSNPSNLAALFQISGRNCSAQKQRQKKCSQGGSRYIYCIYIYLQPHLDVVFLPLWKKLLFSFSGSFYESPTLAPLLPNYHRNCDFDQYIWTCYEWFAPIRHVDRFPALFTWWLFRFYFLTSFLLLLQPATRLGMTYCVCIFVMDRLCLR